MAFDEILKGMTADVGGAEGCFLFDRDGILIQESKEEGLPVDLNGLGAEVSAIVKGVHTAAESTGIGMVDELVISADRYMVVLRMLAGEYYVAMVLRRDGDMGKGRYMLRSRAAQIEAEL